MAPGADFRRAILHYSQLVYSKGWVANHDGNLSTRLGADRVLATPTAMSKADIEDRDLVIVDGEGQRVKGHRRIFSEFTLHRAIYDARDDVGAVIHAHPPAATAFSVCGQAMDRPILAEPVVSIGPSIPLVPFTPLPAATAQMLPQYASRFDVVLLENHGVLAWGSDLEQAFLRLELCEHLAEIERRARTIGTPRYLTWDQIQPLLDKRQQAGLGPEARGMSRAEAYQGPARAQSAASGSDMRRIVAEEVTRALRDGR